MTDEGASRARTSQRIDWSSPLFTTLAIALVVAIVGLTAFFLLRESGEPDLEAGLAGLEIGAEVEGNDLLVVDTVQGVGVFVETQSGPAYVRYGDDTADRFGVGSVVDVEGEVAAVTELDAEEREQVGADVYVVAEEIEVEEQ